MKPVTLIVLNAVIAIALGIAFAIYGPLVVAFFDIPDRYEGSLLLYWTMVSFVRMLGGAFFASGLILWAARPVFQDPGVSTRIRRGVLFGGLLGNIILAIVAFTQQWTVWFNNAGWLLTGIFILLPVGYVYFLTVGSESWENEPESQEELAA